jgi:hypothetical protein
MPSGVGALALYRAYVVGRDGHFVNRHDFEASLDDAALKRAQQYVDGKDVEVWQSNRLVALLKHTDEAA